MNATVTKNWHEANQQYLMAALSEVRQALERHAVPHKGAAGYDEPNGQLSQTLREAAANMLRPPALETLSEIFGLSAFERKVLLLCAGVDLDSSFALLCAAAHGDSRRTHPTFSLALAVLPEAHWSALSPARPLRRWRLIQLGSSEGLTQSPLRIDEWVLHYLTGIHHLDERLLGLVEPLRVPEELPPSHTALARHMSRLWSSGDGISAWPTIQLCGTEPADKRSIAAKGCSLLGLQVHALRATDIPGAASEREAFACLWERESALSGSVLFIDGDDLDGTENLSPVLSFLERTSGLVIVTSRNPLRIRKRLYVRLDVKKPSSAEQKDLWCRTLGPGVQKLGAQVESIVTQFHLSMKGIQAACVEALGKLGEEEREGRPDSAEHETAPNGAVMEHLLWDVCRVHARPSLDDLAQRIDPVARWDDLVLPETQTRTLHEVAIHVRQQATVYERWGFSARCSRGLGISALFVGASGTGKTMAAEVLANELRLDLYRIDLSQVVSKYIGETEKNLRRVFDAAEDGGAILLFDEADALFGKRSEVKDSHDRYANIEVSYLLQRMEAYRGVAILTTNMKSALDPAFMRRIRFVVQFPFPDARQRVEIWRRIFPDSTPTERLEFANLARLNIAGGNIRNIALNGAFLAADEGQPVHMSHLLQAARGEYAKLEKPLTEAEIGGWV
jgi:hypothetical protein